MTPNRLFYQLLVVALALICLLIYTWWPAPRSPASQMPLKPAKPVRKWAKEPKSFTGYIHKPRCERPVSKGSIRVPKPLVRHRR